MNINNILKDFKLKTNWLKKEYKFMMMRSIFQSKNSKQNTKCAIKFIFSKWKLKKSISFQRRTCIILGKNRSVYPRLNLKRHTIKKVNATCLITGLSMGDRKSVV